MAEQTTTTRRRFTARINEEDGTLHVDAWTYTIVTSGRGVERVKSGAEFVEDFMVLSLDEWGRMSAEVTTAFTHWLRAATKAGVKLDDTGEHAILPHKEP